MSVKLTNFVKIKINHHLSVSVNTTRDTAVLIHYKSTLSGSTYTLLTSMPDVTQSSPVDYTIFAGIKDYLQAFFNNGGKNLYVISTNTISTDGRTLADELEKVPMEYMVVGLANDTTSGVTPLAESAFRTAAAAWNTSKADEKIFQKIFVAEIPYASGVADLAAYKDGNNKVVNIENYVLKYGALGVGASVLAYYTALNIYGIDTTQDYNFTTEVYPTESTDHYVFDDNDIVKTVMSLDMNVDTKLAGRIKNVGGNDTAGYDLTNQFMLLFVHQALTTTIVQVLADKIKYNSAGIAVIMNAIVKELNRFVSNGYLTTNKVWTEPDLYYEGYKVIDNNTVLNTGFKVLILPFESLSPTEIAEHQLPKIYILLADSYSIRKVVIDGEVF